METESIVRPKRRYVHRETRESFELAIVEGDPHERPYKLRNGLHYWEGSKDDFEKSFERWL
jgi:hypothetical protein